MRFLAIRILRLGKRLLCPKDSKETQKARTRESPWKENNIYIYISLVGYQQESRIIRGLPETNKVQVVYDFSRLCVFMYLLKRVLRE